MQIDNLRKEDVDEILKKVEELKKENPEIKSVVYKMTSPPSVTLEHVYAKLCEIQVTLSLAFNEHVLVNGIWRKP